MDLAGFLTQTLIGIRYGLLLFLISSGLTLVFGVLGIINLAHGSLFMVGAYTAYLVAGATGSLWIALPVGLLVGAGLGVALERGLFRHFYSREHLDQVLLTFALILLFEEARWAIAGNDFHGVDPPESLARSIPISAGFSYRVYEFFVIGACLLIAALLFLWIEKTRFGAMIRAAAEKPEMVDVLGIDARKIYMTVFAVGTALAVLAGVLAAPLTSVYPGMGNNYLIISFVVVVIGGLGSVSGAFWSALLIGIIDTLGKAYRPKAAALDKLLCSTDAGLFCGYVVPGMSGFLVFVLTTSVYLLMAAVLLWRPTGLFGQR